MKQYLELLRDIIENGVDKEDRTGVGTRSVFGRQMRFDLSDGTLPVVTTKKVHLRSIIHELIWFINGDTNLGYLRDNDVKIWDAWATPEGDLGPIYSQLWRRWPVESKEAVLIAQRQGPAPGPALIPKREVSTRLESNYQGDLEVYQVNGGAPYRIIEDLGTEGGRNSVYLVQFEETLNTARVTRPNIRNGVKVRDGSGERVIGIGILGNPVRSDTRAYNLWYNMLARCYRPTHPSYPVYGGVGVYVSPRWLCYETFQKDLSRLPYYEQWRMNPNEYDLDKDYFGSNCYDVTTSLFLKSSYNKVLKEHRPMQATDSEGNVQYFAAREDLLSRLLISDETLRNHEKGVYEKSRLTGYKVEDYVPPAGYLVRRKVYIDQIGELISNLKERPWSRRHVISGWNPDLLPVEGRAHDVNVRNGKQALPPCHTLFQFMVVPVRSQTLVAELAEKGIMVENAGEISFRELSELCATHGIQDKRLSCQLFQRSCDAPIGLPFNIASYAILTAMLAQVCNMRRGEFVWTGGDVHIYQNQLEPIQVQLAREPYPLPQLALNPDVKDLFAFTFDDIKVEGYVSHPHIKLEVAV